MTALPKVIVARSGEAAPVAVPHGGDVRVQLAGTAQAVKWAFIGLGLAALVGLLIGSAVDIGSTVLGILGMIVLVSPFCALIGALFGTHHFRAGSVIFAYPQWLLVDRGRKKIRVDTFSGGWLSPTEHRVYLQQQNGNLWSAAVADQNTGKAFLECVSLDVSRRPWNVRLGSTWMVSAFAWILSPILASVITAAIHQLVTLDIPSRAALIGILFALTYTAIQRMFGPDSLVIGADGVIVKGPFSARFIRFDDLNDFATSRSGITIFLKNGTEVRARARNLNEATQVALRERIEQAAALHNQVEMSSAALLEKGSRSISDWHVALAGILSKDTGYRRAHVTREQIIKVLENPAAPALQRIGAAIALARSQDVEALKRMRIVAGACVDEKVRIALEGVARGDLENEAIEKLAAEDEAARAKAYWASLPERAGDP
ncbi:MAG: hypothetical protein IPK82_08780 [Polyangiaceae bacterium]|nr:hypothetical protein [Polyangiaceae bacterium]